MPSLTILTLYVVSQTPLNQADLREFEDAKDGIMSEINRSLVIPDSPAAVVTGIATQQLVRPSSFREVTGQLTGTISQNGDFKPGVSIEVAPARIARSKQTIAEYADTKWPVRFVESIRLSFATSDSPDDGGGTLASVGLRMGYDELDYRYNTGVQDAVEKALSACMGKIEPTPVAGSAQSISLTECQNLRESLRQAYSNVQGVRFDLATAFGFTSASVVPVEGSEFRLARSWFALDYVFKRGFFAGFGIDHSYRHDADAADQDAHDVRIGMRLGIETTGFEFGVEGGVIGTELGLEEVERTTIDEFAGLLGAHAEVKLTDWMALRSGVVSNIASTSGIQIITAVAFSGLDPVGLSYSRAP